jgi:DNA-binding MarR family transcriptional regulator
MRQFDTRKILMSKKMSRSKLIYDVMQAVAAFQDATDQVDEAAATRLGLNRTDLRCLGILARTGAMTAGQLAHAAGLSPGATTTAVDRLVRAGYAKRIRDVGDRRRVTIEPTPAAQTASEMTWGPIGAEAHQRLSRRSIDELMLIRDFLIEGCEMQTRHAERITTGDG